MVPLSIFQHFADQTTNGLGCCFVKHLTLSYHWGKGISKLIDTSADTCIRGEREREIKGQSLYLDQQWTEF